MNQVRIIIDSTADTMPQERARMLVQPLTIRFGEEEYIDGVTITHPEFYHKLVTGGVLPTTSQPTPFAFQKLYQQVVDDGDTAVVITISHRLSGTYQSATIAAADFPGQVYVVDSGSVAITAGILAEYALGLADAGRSAEAIAAALEEKKGDLRLIAVVDTLEYLKKGGRISAAVAFAGGLLSIKPVLTVEDGEVKMIGKARGVKQGYASLEQLIADQPVDFGMPFLLGYTGEDDTLLRGFLDHSADIWAGHQVRSTIIGSVVGTHAGPGAYAAAYFVKK